MTDQEILTKAIEKALGKWSAFGLSPNKPIKVTEGLRIGEFENWAYQQIIFDQDFAKALWGEQPQPFSMLNLVRDTSKDIFTGFSEEDEKHTYYLPKWRVMLQQMVIAGDPIKYLGEHLYV